MFKTTLWLCRRLLLVLDSSSWLFWAYQRISGCKRPSSVFGYSIIRKQGCPSWAANDRWWGRFGLWLDIGPGDRKSSRGLCPHHAVQKHGAEQTGETQTQYFSHSHSQQCCSLPFSCFLAGLRLLFAILLAFRSCWIRNRCSSSANTTVKKQLLWGVRGGGWGVKVLAKTSK